MTQVKTASFKICHGPDECRHGLSDRNGDCGNEHVGTSDDPGAQIVQMAFEYRREHPAVSQRDAIEIVMARNPDLARQYNESFTVARKPKRDDPSALLHQKAMSLMSEGICATYSQAAAQAIWMNSTLASRWTGQTNR
jgi:hypothetical protein